LRIVNDNFDLRPGKIIKALNLLTPIYQRTAENGHFGQPDFSWEKPKDLVIPEDLKKQLSLIRDKSPTNGK